MSILADEQANIGFPAHQDFNGDTCIRHPASGDAVSILGVWNEYSEDRLAALRPKRELQIGERIERHGLLLVPRDETVADTDTWTILSEVWTVRRIGHLIGGYREVYVELVNSKKTTRPNPQRTL